MIILVLKSANILQDLLLVNSAIWCRDMGTKSSLHKITWSIRNVDPGECSVSHGSNEKKKN